MRGSKAASRYAQALLDLAIEQNVVDAVAGDMKYLSEVSEANHDFELMLASPIVRTDKKLDVMKAVFDQFEKVSMLFIELIAKNGREAMLPDIAASFATQLRAYRGIVPVTIVSAVQLDGAVKDSIMKKVQASIAGTLEVSEEIDPELIGGFVVRVGDRMIDASVSSQLTQLKQRLTR